MVEVSSISSLAIELASIGIAPNSQSAVGYIAPVDKIPVEIREYIFKLAFQAFSSEKDSPLYLPFILSYISREWRLIALSMPLLWSVIVVRYETEASLSRVYPRIQCQLDRSKEWPLDVTIHGLYVPESERRNVISATIWSYIAPHIHHIQSLNVWDDDTGSHSGAMHNALPPNASFSLLHSITWAYVRLSLGPSLQFPQNAPRLRRLHLGNVVGQGTLINPRILAQLTEVSLDRFYGGSLLSILPFLTSVEVLELDRVMPLPEQFNWQGSTVVFPLLQHLILDDPSSLTFSSVNYPVIHAPVLKCITINSLFSVRAMLAMLPYLEQCMPSAIVVVSCREHKVDMDSVVRLLTSLPDITRLDITFDNRDLAQAFFELLADTTSNEAHHSFPKYCPSLQSIRIQHGLPFEIFPIDLRLLITMVNTRHPSGLKELEIKNQLEPIGDLLEADKLAVEGFKDMIDFRFWGRSLSWPERIRMIGRGYKAWSMCI